MSNVRNGSSGNLSANFPLEQELAKPKLVEGCTVRISCGDATRSLSAFKRRTGKVLRFQDVGGYTFAIVEINMYGSLIEYTCLIQNLEVVE